MRHVSIRYQVLSAFRFGCVTTRCTQCNRRTALRFVSFNIDCENTKASFNISEQRYELAYMCVAEHQTTCRYAFGWETDLTTLLPGIEMSYSNVVLVVWRA